MALAGVDAKLHFIMESIHSACVKFGKQADGTIDYVKGANIAGFMKVLKLCSNKVLSNSKIYNLYLYKDWFCANPYFLLLESDEKLLVLSKIIKKLSNYFRKR